MVIKQQIYIFFKLERENECERHTHTLESKQFIIKT